MQHAFRVVVLCATVLALALPIQAEPPADTVQKKEAERTLSYKPTRKRRETAFETLDATNWTKLFDGSSLKGWKETDFVGRKSVKVDNEQITIEMGNDMTGITWTNDVPRMNYEIVLEAKRVEGNDFFCGLTFPVDKSCCSFICGGWGGGVVGISSINGADAANNETSSFKEFENGKWYRLRVRVTPGEIEAWIDGERVVDVEVQDRTLNTRREVELSKPLGIATWRTTGAIRDIRVRPVDAPKSK